MQILSFIFDKQVQCLSRHGNKDIVFVEPILSSGISAMNRLSILIFVTFGMISPSVFCNLVVVYPDVPAPYNQIFNEIIEGIADKHDGDLMLKALREQESSNSVINWLENQNKPMVIALGKRGYDVAQKIKLTHSVAVGALPIKPSDMSGISLIGHPKRFFESLRQLAPQIHTVNVVYSSSNDWLIGLAKKQADTMGLQLKVVKVSSIKQALRTYDSLFSSIDGESEAIWLPLDPISANEQVILPSLLEQSWEKNIVLFSSKPVHAKRGALFSMYPDHFELGSALVDMVTEIHNENINLGVVPISNMKVAVNLRTAAHLGFKYNNVQKSTFYLTFPQ